MISFFSLIKSNNLLSRSPGCNIFLFFIFIFNKSQTLLPLCNTLIAIAFPFAIGTNDNITPIIPQTLVAHQTPLLLFAAGSILIQKPSHSKLQIKIGRAWH